MIKDNRLNYIVDLIDKNTETLLDIGVDHGFLIKKAFKANKIVKAIAADINQSPLNMARKNLAGLDVEYILSDGFKNIYEQFDLAVIAGLGANTIMQILKDAPKDKITYILQANNKVERLRHFMTNNNFKIIDEVISLENGRFYIIIKATKGSQHLSDEEIYLGPILMKKTSSQKYYQHQLDKFDYLINKQGASPKTFIKEINLLKTILNK